MNSLLVRIVAGIAVTALLAGCGKEDRRTSGAPADGLPHSAVRVAPVQPKTSAAAEEVVGTVRAKLRASVEAKVTARIERMLVEPGQGVKAGDLLIELDKREIQTRLDQALPVLRNAETESKRFRALVEERAVSQSEYDAMEARARVAQASVAEAETMLAYTRITAPFAGVITRKLADVGDLAQPGRSLVEIEDPRVLRVEADVPESLIDHVQLRARMRVNVGARSLEGIVGEISPAADSSTRTFLVKLDLPEQTGLRAGQFARLAIPLDERSSLRVPGSAVVQRGQMELGFVVSSNKAHLRLIKSGRHIGDEVEIVSGLLPGEHIVVEGAAELRDGQPVEVKP